MKNLKEYIKRLRERLNRTCTNCKNKDFKGDHKEIMICNKKCKMIADPLFEAHYCEYFNS